MITTRRLLALVILVAAIAATYSMLSYSESKTKEPHTHIIDRAGIIPRADLPRFDQYMSYIMRESGVDIHMVFLPSAGGVPIEYLTRDMMDELQVGAQTGRERGLLLLYDMEAKQLKVEVGYGLEGWFPDIFVHHLVEDHARMFFSSDNVSLGLRLLLRLLQNRIREAVIHQEFDPRIFEKIKLSPHMSGGGGVNTTMAIGDDRGSQHVRGIVDSAIYPAGTSPAETYDTYLDWMRHWPSTPDVAFFTAGSRAYLSRLPMSPAYSEFILYGELGKGYKIVEKGDVAVLYFTDTPFVSPHFFRRTSGLWQMDLVAEVRNTREVVGGVYTWTYRGKQDDYTTAFGDLLTTIKGFRRFIGGDNRTLTMARTATP